MSITQKIERTNKPRPTIGVIIDSMAPGYQTNLWRGFKSAAEKLDINLLCFLGREFESLIGFRQRANVIYKLVNKNNIDGLVLVTGTVCDSSDLTPIEGFLQSIHPLPVVSVALEIDTLPNVLLDNRQGISEVTAHLIEAHHCQRISFFRMNEGHGEGDERFFAYKETLEKFGLPYDPNLVVPGEYYDRAADAIELLYDERKVTPDAIVVVDDYMALPTLEALNARGISVPEDVAVVGFDDVEEARYCNPPLTTLRQPLKEQAYQSLEIILHILAEESYPQRVELSPKLITRQSCGCFSANIINAAISATNERPLADSLKAYQPQILSHILEISEIDNQPLIQKFLEAFYAAVENDDSHHLLTTFNQILLEVESKNEDALAWQNVISGLHPYVFNILQNQATRLLAEDLLQQSRVMIAEITERIQANRRLTSTELNSNLRFLNQGLNTTREIGDLVRVISQGLPTIGIHEFYISLYAQQDPNADNFTLLLVQNPKAHTETPLNGQIYPATQLLPDEYLKTTRRYTKVIEPLFFEEEQFGFTVIEDEISEESLYDSLGEQISGGIKGVKLVQQAERRAIQLQTAAEVSQAANSVLDPETLIHQTVDLVKERFDLYYVGLFLADDERKWAVLRAGTGEPGEKMLAANWRLEVGGSSMIGRCVATGNPDIQLDVDQAPVHLRNPYLPGTKSELALPLISRGEIIGALTIQSIFAHAFSAEDVTVFQTMAGQLANAIGNANLYDALAREQYLINALMESMPDAIYFKDLESRFLRISRHMVSNFGVEKPSDIIGKTDFDFFTEEHARPAFESEQHIIQTGEPLLNIEELETREDRADTWGLTSKLPLRNERNEIVGTFGITRDITELKLSQFALEHQSQRLQTTIEVARAISEFLDPNELNQQIVDLIKKHFNTYYVGLFIVDEIGENVILRAGTGDAGKNMIAEGWKLKIGGDSMIGRCIQTGTPDIQLDIDKAPTHLRNPHLPETKSEIALPLFSRGKALGALTIQSDLPNAFTSNDRPVLQTMVNQISVALANARLFEQTQSALLETETLLNVSRLASSTLGIDFALPQILDLVLKTTQFEAGLFSILNPDTGKLELHAHQLPEPLIKTLTTNGLDGTLCDLVYQQKHSIIVNDLENQSPIDATGLLNLGFKAYQGAPIETKGAIFGTLCTFSKTKLLEEDSRINLLQAVGQQVGVAFENIQLFQQTQQALAETEDQSKRLQALNELSEELNRVQTREEIFRAGALALNQIMPSERANIGYLVNENQLELFAIAGSDDSVPVGARINFNGSSIEEALTTKKMILIEDESASKYTKKILPISGGVKSSLIVPISVGDRVFGTLNFGRASLNAFSSRDQDFASQVASLMGNAIENQNLLQQTRTALAELESTQRRYQIQAWTTYNRNRESSGYLRRGTGLEPLGRRPISETQNVIQTQTPVISNDGERTTLTVPIMLRDQPIGAIGLQTDEGQRNWTPEEVALVQDISEQFALAAESLRLLDETQRRAARERLVAEITTKLRSSNDPQAMLQTAAQELRLALNAKRAQVLLQSDQNAPTNANPAAPAETQEDEA